MSNEDFDTDYFEDHEEEGGCDYGVCEFCVEPQTKESGLCTTECAAYLKSVEEDAKEKP